MLLTEASGFSLSRGTCYSPRSDRSCRSRGLLKECWTEKQDSPRRVSPNLCWQPQLGLGATDQPLFRKRLLLALD